MTVLEALYREREGYAAISSRVPGIDHPTLTVGRIEGGINTNVVPDKVSLRLDRRILAEEDPAAVEARLMGVICGAAEGRPGISVEIRRLLLARPLVPLPGHERLVSAISARASEAFGEPVSATGSPLYTDARLYCEAGIPTVLYGAGPRTILEANAKRADENLLLDDLRRATIVVAGALCDLLGSS